MSERHIEKFGDNEYYYNPATGQWRPVVTSPAPEPDPDYLEEYSKEALAELDAEGEIDPVLILDEDTKPLIEMEETGDIDIFPDEDGVMQIVAENNDFQGDLLYEEFSHIESWDDVVQEGAMLVMDIESNYFSLGKLVNFACSKRKPGRPGEEDRTVARLSGQINVNRSTLSMCAACEEFYRLIREDLPKQISLRQLNDARVNAGWKPGKEVEAEQLTLALNTVIEIVEGKWAKPKKSRTMTPADYAKRIAADAQKGLELVDAKGGDLPGMFIEIIEIAQDIWRSWSEYREILVDGESIIVGVGDETPVTCCDCGLTHLISLTYDATSHLVCMTFRRDRERTKRNRAQLRRKGLGIYKGKK